MATLKTAWVHLWGDRVGAVAWDPEREVGAFEYDPDFLRSGLEIAPLQMPLAESAPGAVYEFPTLNRETFFGLPGLLADTLPDKFGNAIIDAWLSRQGRDARSFTPVERLCYAGRRGMGALEFSPPENHRLDAAVPVEIAKLVVLAQDVMAARLALDTEIEDELERADALLDILRVGTSAGGARPKAVVAMNDDGYVLSGQGDAPPGYDYWLLKFDGVADLELGKTEGYGRIEYAYYRMALSAGIEMTECRLLEESGRAHFMTRRFDREGGDKVHMTSLCGVAHHDFNRPGVYGYEQAFTVMRRLRLPKSQAVQLYRRMLFNVVARNLDDHTKNIAFLMGRDGVWRLAPAFDVIYAHNPKGRWTNQHQMTIAGKRDGFTRAELVAVGESIGLRRPAEILDEVIQVVGRWADYAEEAGVDGARIGAIAAEHRLDIT
ncbi:type II toxin-antitoxin system HipA family toxin [Thiohalomonas denitrificans]|uniref:type II toxin-antitoxin system HipA family toxin n=1 Tax=Thiohalomonas denitrificans TaxID=415747 RepID=UPI0026EF9E4C|nr:type II toxin-antitoxin system HipA family toxin [Thiohalomonas denitrificans]